MAQYEKPYDTIVSPGRKSTDDTHDLVEPKFKSFRAQKNSVQDNIKITEELPYVNQKKENAR